MTQITHVPFADLHAQYQAHKTELDAAIADVIATSGFIRGPYVANFETDFAQAIGASHCVSCANGTDAIYIAMMALDIKPGDEVIVPSMSWISTSETVTQAGGVPVFCDIDPLTYTIDPELIAEKVTDRTVGIIPVHLYGQPCDMGKIMALANSLNLWVIEDCAQSHLATFDGQSVGTFGDAATFSFYPGKNLGAMGDAGGIVTNNADLAAYMEMFARHGGKGQHTIEGINSRLDGLQAAILVEKLKHLPVWTARRREIAERYTEGLKGVGGITCPHIGDNCDPVWHLYVIQHADREGLKAELKSRGISTVINYPTALPFLPAYDRFNHTAADFPVAHAMQSRILSLPIFAEMTNAQVDYVIAQLKDISAQTGRG